MKITIFPPRFRTKLRFCSKPGNQEPMFECWDESSGSLRSSNYNTEQIQSIWNEDWIWCSICQTLWELIMKIWEETLLQTTIRSIADEIQTYEKKCNDNPKSQSGETNLIFPFFNSTYWSSMEGWKGKNQRESEHGSLMLKGLLRFMSKWIRFGHFQQIQVPSKYQALPSE